MPDVAICRNCGNRGVSITGAPCPCGGRYGKHANVPQPRPQDASTMNEHDLIERLADKEHASWARWMDYLFSRCERTSDGFLLRLPYARRLKVQAATPYAELSEQEKQSDRDEVAHILPIIREYAGQA